MLPLPPNLDKFERAALVAESTEFYVGRGFVWVGAADSGDHFTNQVSASGLVLVRVANEATGDPGIDTTPLTATSGTGHVTVGAGGTVAQCSGAEGGGFSQGVSGTEAFGVGLSAATTISNADGTEALIVYANADTEQGGPTSVNVDWTSTGVVDGVSYNVNTEALAGTDLVFHADTGLVTSTAGGTFTVQTVVAVGAND